MQVESGGEGGSGWSEHRTRDGASYYHNCRSGESQWERPEDFDGQSMELSKDEIQVGIRWEYRWASNGDTGGHQMGVQVGINWE